ncbi:MAG: hypothetical protein V4491_05575, partial [Pseudomonadota bacterium]
MTIAINDNANYSQVIFFHNFATGWSGQSRVGAHQFREEAFVRGAEFGEGQPLNAATRPQVEVQRIAASRPDIDREQLGCI